MASMRRIGLGTFVDDIAGGAIGSKRRGLSLGSSGAVPTVRVDRSPDEPDVIWRASTGSARWNRRAETATTHLPSSARLFGRRRDDALQTQVGDQLAIVFVAVRVVERKHQNARRLIAIEKLYQLETLLIVQAREHPVTLRDGVGERRDEIGL